MQRQTVEFRGHENNRIVGDLYQPDPVRPKGPPALFMHGGGQTRHSWRGAAKQLAHLGITTLTLDARGHGESEWVTSQDYSFHAYRADLIKLAQDSAERFGAPPILIGASMGGIAGMLAAGEAGSDIFTAMIFVDITPTMAPSGVDRVQGFMAQNMREGFESVEQAADAIAHYLPDRPRPKSLDGLRKNLREGDDGRFYWHWDPAFIDGPLSINTQRDESGHLLQEGCKAITVPTLLVRGSRSELVSEEAAQEFLQLVPHAKFVDVTNAGHMVAGDRNDIFASSVIDFLKQDVL